MALSTRIRSLIRNQWAGLIALFLVVTGGTAYALAGSNTVFTDDIVNGQVRSADVAEDSGPFALQGNDVLNNSLTGADIDESTLEVVQQPLLMAIPDSGDGTIATIHNVSLTGACGTVDAILRVDAPSEGVGVADVIAQSDGGTGSTLLLPDAGLVQGAPHQHWVINYRLADGRQVVYDVTALKSVNAIGDDDCFFQGFAQYTP